MLITSDEPDLEDEEKDNGTITAETFAGHDSGSTVKKTTDETESVSAGNIEYELVFQLAVAIKFNATLM